VASVVSHILHDGTLPLRIQYFQDELKASEVSHEAYCWQSPNFCNM